MLNEIMLDLETLSTRSNAAILIIGAIKFNRHDRWDSKRTLDSIPPEKKFYQRIFLKSNIDASLHIDPETEKWWKSQEEKVQYEVFSNPDRITLSSALLKFKSWCGRNPVIWGNGSSFDETILRNAYVACDITVPWKFWNVRDLRTLYDLGNVKSYQVPNNNKHNALDDCFAQIKGLQMALKNLNF